MIQRTVLRLRWSAKLLLSAGMVFLGPSLVHAQAPQDAADITATGTDDTTKPNPGLRFRIRYEARIQNVAADSQLRVWVPIPRTGPHQTIESVTWQLPAEGHLNSETEHGNSFVVFDHHQDQFGNLPLAVTYDVTRLEVNAFVGKRAEPLDAEARMRYLAPARLIPVGELGVAELDAPITADSTVSTARVIYQRVLDFVTYDKSKIGYGEGDVRWVCESRTGNCSDFHSLFISLARHHGIPARFEMGFALPEQSTGPIAGYHCWASFYDDEVGWIPVDISEADKHPELKNYCFGNLSANRVGVSVGRDLVLEPAQQGPRVNFLIYPYAEEDGKPVDKARISWEVTCEPLPESGYSQ